MQPPPRPPSNLTPTEKERGLTGDACWCLRHTKCCNRSGSPIAARGGGYGSPVTPPTTAAVHRRGMADTRQTPCIRLSTSMRWSRRSATAIRSGTRPPAWSSGSTATASNRRARGSLVRTGLSNPRTSPNHLRPALSVRQALGSPDHVERSPRHQAPSAAADEGGLFLITRDQQTPTTHVP